MERAELIMKSRSSNITQGQQYSRIHAHAHTRAYNSFHTFCYTFSLLLVLNYNFLFVWFTLQSEHYLDISNVTVNPCKLDQTNFIIQLIKYNTLKEFYLIIRDEKFIVFTL